MGQFLAAEDYPSVIAEDLVRLDAVALRKTFAFYRRAEPPLSVLIHTDASHYPRLLIGVDNAVHVIDVRRDTTPISFTCPHCKKSKNRLYLYKLWACQTCHHLTKLEGACKHNQNVAKKIFLHIQPWLKSKTQSGSTIEIG